METLGKLFGSETKLKVIRLFLFNPETMFETSAVAERAKSDISKVRRELSTLEKIGLIKRKNHPKKGFVLNQSFPYLLALQSFLLNIEPLSPKEILKRFTKLGSIKLVLVSGVFIQDPESRADILVVGDGLKKTNLENTIKTLESEIGRELKYAYFTTEDFKYRLSMFDKLTRDILDYPHKVVVDKLGIL